MREISFRGKRYCNGKWVEGSLLAWPDGSTEICYDNPENDDEFLKSIVYPETVGQNTGLTDKQDKLIFEGDIVRYVNKDGTPAFYKVVWGDSCGAWMLEHQGEKAVFSVAGFHLMVEIIGNVHDNPDLLAKG